MLGAFELYYPVVMSLVWIIGSIFYILVKKKPKPVRKEMQPSVEILMSCFNEEQVLEACVKTLVDLDYENYTITLIDDKSTDNTVGVMRKLRDKYPQVKVIESQENLGKAEELNRGLEQSRADYILCVDADAIFDQHALSHLVATMEDNRKLGAVTGRPIVKNTKTVIGKLQYLEYIMNIDFIKRAQDMLSNNILTVSGVIVLYRREALLDIKGWNTEVLTEDIDATWRLYRADWNVGYQPEALCYIYVPETIRGFIKQRTRWARGGIEVFLNRFKEIPQLTLGRQFLSLDIIFSYAWVFAVTFSTICLGFEFVFLKNLMLRLDILVIYYATTLMFYLASRIVNFKHDFIRYPHSFFLYLPVFFYAYWLNNIVVVFSAFYHMFDRSKYAAWGDSDRGTIE